MNISSHVVYKFVEKAYVECGYSVGYATSLYRLMKCRMQWEIN